MKQNVRLWQSDIFAGKSVWKLKDDLQSEKFHNSNQSKKRYLASEFEVKAANIITFQANWDK